jgi:hypothetical protein
VPSERGRILVSASVRKLTPGGRAAQRRVPAPDKTAAPKEAAFHDAMRKLWEEHITWTRVFIISAAGDLPDKDAATQRLLQNQVDIGNAVKPYSATGPVT